MTTLTEALTENTLNEPLTTTARELVAKLLLPQRITGEVIEKYFRKALRVGAWRALRKEARALILAARNVRIGTVKSPVLATALKQAFLTIELHTLKGKALYYGVIITMKQAPHTLKQALTKTKQTLTKILIEGISYLNNPPTLRIYG